MNKEKHWFEKLSLAMGSKSSSSWNYVTKRLNPNDEGNINDNIRDVTLAEILGSLRKDEFRIDAERKLYYSRRHGNTDKKAKDFALSLYSFHGKRYKMEDVDENGKTVHHNASFIHNIGFQGFDFDPPKDTYNVEQRREIAVTMKHVLYDILKDKPWFIWSTLSTGGNGTHCYTWSKPNEFIDDDEKVRLYYTNYDMKLFHMCRCLIELKNRLPWVDLDIIKIDPAMRRPGQTVNITVCDTMPLVNYNFDYCDDEEVKKTFFKTDKTYFVMDDVSYAMCDEYTKAAYDLYMKYIKVTMNDKTKYDKNDKDYNEFIEIKSNFVDLENCEPTYWRHSVNSEQGWTGNQVIHTLLWFFDKDEVKAIWAHPNFYTSDPKDWIRFVDTWQHDESIMPNFRLIRYLNEHCGFDLQYDYIIRKKTLEEQYDHVIKLADDEYLGDYSHELFNNCFKKGINLLISGVGTGKTNLWIQRDKRMNSVLMDIGTLQTTIITEPYNAILETKFGDGGYKCPVYKGNKYFSWGKLEIGLCAANYKKIIQLAQRTNQDWNAIDYIVCDESHLLTKEAFRYGDLIDMISFLKEAAKHVPVILMTGTPCDELDLFDDVNTIFVEKKDARDIKYRWLRFQADDENKLKRWDIISVVTLIKSLYIEGRKVYLYDGDCSLRKFKKLKRALDIEGLNTCIYHKRHIDDIVDDDEDMRYIDKNHALNDKFDVILSSCYFGVGNDLNDECDAACIIIGNHTWQEDVQVVGRWRNSKDIKVYNIIFNWEENMSGRKNKKLMLEDMCSKIKSEYNDFLMRDKNIAIGDSVIHIENVDDIPTVALMKINEMYNSPLEYKREKLSENYFHVNDNQIVPLRWCNDDIESIQKINDDMKKLDKTERGKFIKALAKNKVFKWHNEDARLLKWQKTTKYIFDNYRELFNHIFVKTHWGMYYTNLDSLSLFMRICRRYKHKNDSGKHDDMIDWAEIKSYELYRHFIGSLTDDELKEKDDDMIEKIGISYVEHMTVACYVYMAMHTNKNYSKNNHVVMTTYFNTFKNKCVQYNNMHDMMHDVLMSLRNEHDTVDNDDPFKDFDYDNFADFSDKIIDVYDRKKTKNPQYELYLDLYKRLIRRKSYAVSQAMKQKTNAKKKVTVNETLPVKFQNKYNLTIGQCFDSINQMSEAIGVTRKTISAWLKLKYLG